MSDRPLSLRVEDLEKALVESVETTTEERSNLMAAGAAFAPIESGIVSCEPQLTTGY